MWVASRSRKSKMNFSLELPERNSSEDNLSVAQRMIPVDLYKTSVDFFFLPYWGLNSGSSPQFFVIGFFEIGSPKIFAWAGFYP
jgi:hypothetical protein